MKYNPQSIQSALEAAKHCAEQSGKTWYVYATYKGFRVTKIMGISGQQYYRIEPSGETTLWNADLSRYGYAER